MTPPSAPSAQGVLGPVDLTGQVALVTGASRGLGRVYAQALARAGAAVALNARSADQLAETASLIERDGGRAATFPADAADPAQVAALVSAVADHFGPIDLLVNNAGTSGSLAPFADIDPADWWRTLEVNLRGPMLCARAVLPSMLALCRGRIVNVSSGAGNQAWPLASAYATSKAALTRLTENLAAELRDTGVAVFAISPGIVRTAMVEGALHQSAAPAIAEQFRTAIAEGRAVPPERSAALVLTLASGAADPLSGHFIWVGHDLAALLARAEEVRRDALHLLRLRPLPT
ncbi:MAG TPA: SDR family oxidoreductase [Chloroflexota bacterium]|nr:SDR family oxidoreductase [Chloroflexota bacterium]